MPCFKTQLVCFLFCCFFLLGKMITNTVSFFFFFRREINEGFCCKTLNGIASFGLKTISLLAVGTKMLH